MSDIIKTAIEYPPKLASDKVSYVNFFKSAQITKKQKKKDNLGHVVLLFDIKLK